MKIFIPLFCLICLSGCCSNGIYKAQVLDLKEQPIGNAIVKSFHFKHMTHTVLPDEATTDENGIATFNEKWCVSDGLAIWVEHPNFRLKDQSYHDDMIIIHMTPIPLTEQISTSRTDQIQ